MLNSVVNYIRCFYEIANHGAIINHILHRLPGISRPKVWVEFQKITNARVALSPSIYWHFNKPRQQLYYTRNIAARKLCTVPKVAGLSRRRVRRK